MNDEFRKACLVDLPKIMSLKPPSNHDQVTIMSNPSLTVTYQEYQWLRRDNIGHFALRLAFCSSPEDKKWFMTQEIELFKIKFAVSHLLFLTFRSIAEREFGEYHSLLEL